MFEALGATDELASFIGYAREHCLEAGNALPPVLELIQGHIQELNSHIATPRGTTGEARLARTTFPVRYAEHLETEIDALDDYLPPLTNFILASGGKASSSLQVRLQIVHMLVRKWSSLYGGGGGSRVKMIMMMVVGVVVAFYSISSVISLPLVVLLSISLCLCCDSFVYSTCGFLPSPCCEHFFCGYLHDFSQH